MDVRQGELIAIRALEWLASDDGQFHSFLATTGASIGDAQSKADDPEFLAAALDHLLASDKRVLEFCESAGVAPEAPMRARQFLPGGDAPHWT